jgi:hypothetical protein
MAVRQAISDESTQRVACRPVIAIAERADQLFET